MPASQRYARIQSSETPTYKCLDYRAKRSSRSKCLIYGLRYTRYTETIYLHSYYMQIKLFCQQLGYQKAELVQHYQNTYIIVGLSNILYSERFKEGSKFFFGREPGQGAHR